MYESRAPFGALPCAVNKPADANASPRTPVLITEQQLLFASRLPAMPLRPAKPSRRWTGTARLIGASLRAMFPPTTSNEVQPRRRHYPSRNNILEDSRMTREMLRL